MSTISGATKQSLAQLLAGPATTHSVIESLYLRFDVESLATDTNPNKLRKTTHLVKTLGGRPGGNEKVLSLINYVASDSFGHPEFKRGTFDAKDLYENLDRDLAAAGPAQASPPREPSNSGQIRRPGSSANAKPVATPESKRYVFVVRGRDADAYNALAAFLTSLDLRIVTWEDAVRGAGGGSPHTLDIVRAGVEMANAVVVLMTPDDLGQVKPQFNDAKDNPREASLSGQARQNVIFEAGWAMALNQDGVILVRVGDVRPLSDIDGLNYVWLTNDLSSRRTLINRLRNCDLAVDSDADGWRTAGTFPEHP